MKEKLINGRTLLFVEVGEGYTDFAIQSRAIRVKGMRGEVRTRLYWSFPGGGGFIVLQDGKGKYKLIGIASSLSEEEWKGITDSWDNYTWAGFGFTTKEPVFQNYSGDAYVDFKRTATESGLSLLSSMGYSPEKTIVIEKVK